MTPDFLKYIRHLSKQDRKTLSQKALKTAEEVGELAKVVLPFDNAYATTHRFTERESILEEAVDTVLCALSVAYDLNFTDDEVEEMFNRKSEKWALLQSKEADVVYPLPYEVHITVKIETSGFIPEQIAYFRKVCGQLNVKPIILDLFKKGKPAPAVIDVMTSSRHFGNNRSAYIYAKEIEAGLIEEGYNVVRVKIETVPWHPAAPIDDQPMPTNCYYESHIPVVLTEDKIDALRAAAAPLELHASQNVFKRMETGEVVLMLTLRKYEGNRVSFEQLRDQCVVNLSQQWNVGKVITEFSVYDTKVSHDNSWITSQ